MEMLRALHELALDDEITLFKLSNYDLGGVGESYYFTNSIGVTHNKIDYATVGCELQGMEFSSEGIANDPKLVVLDPINFIGKFNKLEGAYLDVLVTQRRFLDDMPTRNPRMIKYKELYRVVNKVKLIRKQYIEFQLINDAGTGSIKIGCKCLRTCTHIYKDGNCGYVPGRMFTLENKPTNNINLDECEQTVTACDLRGNIGRFRGVPTVGRY